MLAGSLSPEDEDAVLAELEAITQVGLIVDYTVISHSFSSFPLIFLVPLNCRREMLSYLKFPQTSCPKLQSRNQVCCFICFGFFALLANMCSRQCRLIFAVKIISRKTSDFSDRSWMLPLFQRRNVPERSQSESCSLRRSLAELSCWTSTNCQTQTFPGELSPHQRPEILPLCPISLRCC